MNQNGYEYDIGLSFAGQQRSYVEEVASSLQEQGVRVFYDDYEAVSLWGKDLYSHLSEVYEHLCRYCVLFVSEEYAQKVWTNHERKSAQARALKEQGEYILPVRFDDTSIPGLPDTVFYVDARTISPVALAERVVEKLGRQVRDNYLPPVLDLLFKRLDLEGHEEEQTATSRALSFMQAVRRMEDEERQVVLSLLRFGCPGHMPDDIHINVDLLQRHTGKAVPRLKRLLGGVRSLGFQCAIREGEAETPCSRGTPLGEAWFFDLHWHDFRFDDDLPAPLEVAYEMVLGVTEDKCADCSVEFLRRLDFSSLGHATSSADPHLIGGDASDGEE